MRDPNLNTAPAEAYSPGANRVGPDASPRLAEHFVRFLVLVGLLVREYWLAFRDYRTGRLPSWWHCRENLPPGSVQQLAASIRGEFGNAIAWMCRRRGIGPDHPDWPEIRCAIIAFGGSVKGFRPGLPACGLQWWENSRIVPCAIGDVPATPAADAMARLLSRSDGALAPPPARVVPSAAPMHAGSPAPQRRVLARASTGPPTGPPFGAISSTLLRLTARGRSTASPAVLIRAAAMPRLQTPTTTSSSFIQPHASRGD
jgi:hypothetical protein